jgi:hypothetical protein
MRGLAGTRGDSRVMRCRLDHFERSSLLAWERFDSIAASASLLSFVRS